jgi:Leucine-rich repeat (LRR) protein
LRELPDGIGNLLGITSFDASKNLLTDLPSSLAKLTNLRLLMLANNNLAYSRSDF